MKTVKTEILVAGGGVAGCAAAIAAAREGHKVILIEKSVICGGLATAGNVIYYLAICDGYGKQVIHGLAEEFMLESVKYGLGYGPGKVNDWKNSKGLRAKNRYAVTNNPASFVLALDELLRQAGVDVWFDTVLTKAVTEGGKVTGVECYNKSGILQIKANRFIDATGDADLAVSAGCPYNVGMNIMGGWTLEYSPGADKNRLAVNPANGKKEEAVEGISGKMISKYALRSREILLDSYKKTWKEKKGYNIGNHYPVTLPTSLNVRKTRAIKGRSYMDDSTGWSNFNDSVAILANWCRPEFMWSIPFGALVPKQMDNLLVVGRCIDSREGSWDNTRLIPVSALTGNIAGIAAGLSIRLKRTVQNLPIDKFQNKLVKQGHILNFEQAYGKNWKNLAEERLSEIKNREKMKGNIH